MNWSTTMNQTTQTPLASELTTAQLQHLQQRGRTLRSHAFRKALGYLAQPLRWLPTAKQAKPYSAENTALQH
jgi:hypothetical protein